MTNLQPNDESYILESRPYADVAFDITQGPLVICSTPPAIYRSPAPSLIALLALITEAIPDAHKRLTVSPPTETGRPASKPAIRATFRLSSPA